MVTTAIATHEERILTFPWEPERPFRVVVVRADDRQARVRTAEPEPGCYEGEYLVSAAWLA